MQEGKVSILMPFKNTAHFLEECVNSILEQSYDNWELIAVDDHSSDNSYKIVLDFQGRDPRIRVLTNQGDGIISALRTAYSSAEGQFITRMDSDDIMVRHKLLSMVENLQKSGKGHVALGLVKYFSEEGISEGYSKYENWINQLTMNGANYTDIYKECVIPSPCWMVYKEDLDTCGSFEPNRYPEDYDLTFRFRKHHLKCIPCSDLLHMWRDYPSRTSRTSENYAQNSFLDLKVHYFLELDKSAERPLALWGAGEKGKTIAKLLLNNNVSFSWLCDNPKKIGKKIYGLELYPYQLLERLNHPQSIVSVANPDAQSDIRNYFHRLEMEPFRDYYFFC